MKYLDASLPVDERVRDLLGRMTIEDKIAQLGCLFYTGDRDPDWERIARNRPGHIGLMLLRDNPGIIADTLDTLQKRVIEANEWHIPALIHIEAITGAMFPGAVTFPSALAQSSTWHPELLTEMAGLIRKQMRAVGFRHALSPVFDIGRDPRWGRLTETYGEDETLASAMASAFVHGLQGNKDTEAIAATGKHFVGHGITEGGLNMGQNPISERELLEIHCKPFQAAITEAGLMGVMNSYCSINREPVISSKRLLTDLLRTTMGFDGILVSDYTSIDRLLNPFQLTDNHVDAGIMALKAGLDVEYPEPTSYNENLIAAVKDGRLDPDLIDRSVGRVLRIKFRLGLFENHFSDREAVKSLFQPGFGSGIERKIAGEAVTLLKNHNRLLPVDSASVGKVAVIGPHADRVRSLFGHYTYASLVDNLEDMKNNQRALKRPEAAMPDGVAVDGSGFYQLFAGCIRETPVYVEDIIRHAYPQSKSLYQAFRDYLPNAEVVTAQGISYTGNNITGYEDALDCAASADLVILTLGGQNGWGVVSTNGEGIDNSNIGLPGKQEQFAQDVYKLGKKTVVVHIDGKPLSSEYVASHFEAIIEAWQLGQYGFEELVKVIFGEICPGGKLPLTVARGADRLPAYYAAPRGTGYVSAGRFGVVSNYYGYVNDTARPLYYFGHGLSYTEFAYSNLIIKNPKVDAGGKFEFSLDVKNTGAYDGDEVVQIYISDAGSSVIRPDRQLAGFKRVSLRKGESKTIRFTIEMSQLAFLDMEMNWKVEGGMMNLLAGASCNDIRLTGSFEITGDAKIDPAKRAFYAKAEV
jgi:beta-glucosidase